MVFFSLSGAQQPSQIRRPDLLQTGHRVNDFAAQLLVDERRAQPLELARHHLPTHRAVEKTFVISLLSGQNSPVIEHYLYAAWHLIGEKPAVIFRRPHSDFAQQRLNVRAPDSSR